MFRLSRFLLLACAAGYMACAAPVLAADTLMMATTTSTQDSGLLEYLEPVFKQETGIELKWVAVGTGKALEIAKNCDADVLLVHAPSAELEFVKAGHGVDRRQVMYNDFVIVGPVADPAGVKGQTTAEALKRILDASDDHSTNAPILCFIDEVLRGTNTVERISASSEILMDFAGRGIACFAATHDIELCSLLETEYDNYHFTESIVDSDIQFSYKLLAGRADSRNAIKLLGAIGYDKSIIANAEERAGRFLSTGEWS